MKPHWILLLLAWVTLCDFSVSGADKSPVDGNRLTYLDSDDPFYPNVNFPKLTTPQWVGDPGVEAVVILAVDDMRSTTNYERFLRPILERLKKIDGRAPVSIMVNAIDPAHPQLQSWLKEGLSLEVHTLAHPCPCLARGDFNAAVNTYHGCVDLLNRIPGNRPVAFRMPCCDSMNSPSPRFYAEIFNRVSSENNFLTIDSSVMCILTTNDTSLPRELVLDRDGREKFRKYLPAQTNAVTKLSMGSFVTTIDDYPYPYVINKLCWELPCMVPSDWEANNLHGPTNPVTVADWKAALDAVVLKQGVFTFIFHPHGWIRSEQMVDFIDYAAAKYGPKVKFLNFREVQERLDRNLLAGSPLRDIYGKDNGVRMLDLNSDHQVDLVIGNKSARKTRLWNPLEQRWDESEFPTQLSPVELLLGAVIVVEGHSPPKATDSGLRFGILHDGRPSAIVARFPAWKSRAAELVMRKGWNFEEGKWVEDLSLLAGAGLDDLSLFTAVLGSDCGVRLRDLDNDGRCELIVGTGKQNAVFAWSSIEKSWKKLDYALPPGASIVDAEGRDAGLRFVDVNGDGYDDILFSNEERFSLHLFIPKANPRLMWKVGWNDEVFSGKRGESPIDIPMIVRGGTNRNNGVWFKNGTMWVQNEDTASLPDKVDRRSFRELLTADQPRALSPEQSLAAIKVRPGFKVELVASEPLIHSPIAFDWSADGRLWVVEMGDYPAGLPTDPERGRSPSAAATTAEARTEPSPRPSASGAAADGGRSAPRPRPRPAGEWDGVIGRPGGRVVILEDTDGDGRYEKSTVFLDGLSFPTGIIPWRKGVIIASAPDIFYAEDTDGDGKADVRRTLFTGFVEGNPQHRLNGFDYGLDGWIYGANGDSGGEIRRVASLDPDSSISSQEKEKRGEGEKEKQTASPSAPLPLFSSAKSEAPVQLRSHDFRFRPDIGEFEAIEGQTQYGRHRDDWGNWFGNNNPTWLWHFWIPERYLARNPHLAVKSTRQMLANYENSTRLYPASRTRQRFNDHHQFNHVTSGNSPTPYRDDLFGPDFATSVFISDPVHNLVHREVLEPDGVTFKSHRASDEQQSEFLASADNWFRPTMLRTGPDGALYIADMYRLVIEHPEWIPKWMQQRLDLRAGSDKGRIYRVTPIGATPRKIPRLDQLDSTGLVAALDSPNGWQRDTVQRILTHKQDKGAVEGLKLLSVEAKEPRVRVQALWTIAGLEAVDFVVIKRLFYDEHPGVREAAIAAGEALLSAKAQGGAFYSVMAGDTLMTIARQSGITSQALLAANPIDPTRLKIGQKLVIPGQRGDALATLGELVRLADDTDPRVRLQLALALGATSDPRAGRALAQIALKDADQPLAMMAVMSSAVGHAGGMLKEILQTKMTAPGAAPLVEKLLALLGAEKDESAIVAATEPVLAAADGGFAPWQYGALAGLLDALEAQQTSQSQTSIDLLKNTLKRSDEMFTHGRQDALDGQRPMERRLAAIRLVGRRDPTSANADALERLLQPSQQPEIQKAALDAFSREHRESVAQVILRDWGGLSPMLRMDAMGVLLSRSIWIHALLTALETGQIPAGQLSLPQQQKLLKHADGSIRERAAKLYAATRSDRQALLKEYAGVEKLKGDAAKGLVLFKQNCGTCHRLNGEGTELGPDLGTMAGKPIEMLLIAILDPNQAVEARYVNYTAVTKSGREASGIITTETANSITLRAANGAEEVLLRTDLKELTSSGLSLMPEGFEKSLKPQDLADLLAHILGPPPPKP